MPFENIKAERVIIRRFHESDVEPFAAYRKAPYAKSVEEARTFLRRFIDGGPDEHGYLFAVELRESGELVGDIALMIEEPESRQAEVGYVLAEAHQGRGLAQEMVSALLDYAFKVYDLHRVTAIVDVRNAPSWRLLERLGFRREGHTLQSYWIAGEWIDEYIYAVLHDEWFGERDSY